MLKNINLNYENNRKKPNSIEAKIANEKGLIVGVEIDMVYGKNIAVEVDIDNVMDNYEQYLKKMSKDFPEDSDYIRKQLDKDTMNLTKNMALIITYSILQKFDILVDKIFTEKKPKTYAKEIDIIEKAYKKYVGDSLENIVAIKMILDVLAELNAKKEKDKENHRKKGRYKNK